MTDIDQLLEGHLINVDHTTKMVTTVKIHITYGQKCVNTLTLHTHTHSKTQHYSAAVTPCGKVLQILDPFFRDLPLTAVSVCVAGMGVGQGSVQGSQVCPHKLGRTFFYESAFFFLFFNVGTVMLNWKGVSQSCCWKLTGILNH